LTLFPHWEGPGNKIEFVRFTDGITNTVCPYRNPFPVIQSLTSTLQLLKIINRKAGLTDEEIDNDAVLMRAYGNGTEILIDRESMRFPGLPPKALSPFAPDSGPMRQTP
jgi:ethanolamine kinase